MIAVNHNLDVYYLTNEKLNDAMELDWIEAREIVPDWILDIEDQGHEILKSRNPHKLLQKKAASLGQLVSVDYR